MDFRLTDEQQLMQDMFREFAEKEIKPLASEIDEKQRFPDESIPQMAEIGMFGITVPEELGGAGLGTVEYAIAVEEISKACATTGVIILVHTSLCVWPILKYGTPEQIEKYIPDLAAGEKLGAFGLTEPGAGTDVSAQNTVAVDMGDHWLINGSKIFISNGGEAGTYVVIAVTDKTQGKKGMSAFIVEKDFPGFKVGGHEKKMGIRGSATTGLVFDDMRVPKENILGKAGDGFNIAMAALDGARIAIGAQALGIAQGAIDEAKVYVQTRTQFGKPISAFQNTRFSMADMQTKADVARLLVYRAANACDQDEPYSHLASMAKLFASEAANEITGNCVQLYGGYGFSREYPVERMMRDAKVTALYGGTSEAQRMVISRWMGVR